MSIIEETLERVVELAGDPKDEIYTRLFALRPEFEDQFVMDKDGGVRANMLISSIDCIRTAAKGSERPALLLEAARLHHDGYGLSASDIDLMFVVIRDVCRKILACEWTDKMEMAWSDALAVLAVAERQ